MKRESGGFRMLQREQVLEGFPNDSYKPQQKLREPARCPSCGITYQRGRWTREPAPASATKHTCPACRRIHDDFPAGYVTLSGAFLPAHLDEIHNLVRHCESAEAADHPLQRIMNIKRSKAEWLITTTDVHLARHIAERLHRAYKGTLELNYSKEENVLRAHWSR